MSVSWQRRNKCVFGMFLNADSDEADVTSVALLADYSTPLLLILTLCTLLIPRLTLNLTLLNIQCTPLTPTLFECLAEIFYGV